MDACRKLFLSFGLLLSLTTAASEAAAYRSTNFMVEAPTPEIAKQVAERAEACRVAVAKAWLGETLTPWSAPCPIKVKLTNGEAGGITSFGFSSGRVSDQDMTVEGRLDRILASALPHEVTHTIFAAFFGQPMPRWADEGASLLSEDRVEHQRHDKIVDNLIGRRGNFPLTRLFTMEDYPRDLMGFYGQGYSVSRFLIEMGGRPRFLEFVRDGMQKGWDGAARSHYAFDNVRELDRAWHAWHKVNAEAVASNAPKDGTVVRASNIITDSR